jgi:hypothetical protein
MKASWCHFEVRLRQAIELAGKKDMMRSRTSAGNLSKVDARLVPVCTDGTLSHETVGEPRSSEEIRSSVGEAHSWSSSKGISIAG